jgi:hypothetical protein
LQAATSSQHAQWLGSTFRAGVLVRVEGELAGDGLVHAYRVRAVPVEPVVD